MNRKPSKQQEEILNKQGKFIVKACAGSGKTLTLSKKLANLIDNNTEPHKGIATLSFTNAAWKEIEKNLYKWNREIKYPNFIGTFDKFINKFIFYKYYYLLNEFNKRPLLVGDLINPWRKEKNNDQYQKFFDIISFDKDDNLIKTKEVRLPFDFKKYNKNGAEDGNYKNLKKMKKRLYKKGFVTQADINYFSLKLLEEFDFISENVANKFPIFLIDESQDTNDIKMSIMNIILSKDSIKEFIFIGDPNQAIYEWNGAKPELFEDLAEQYDTINLNENWRSSQNICNLSSKLSGIQYNAVNDEVKDYPFIPLINGYDEPKENKSEFFNGLISDFLETCEEHDIKLSEKNVAVLCKGNNLIKTINKQTSFDKKDLGIDKKDIVFDLIYAKFLFDQNKFNESYERFESFLISISLNKNHINHIEKKKYITKIGFSNMRKLCLDLIRIMPSTKGMPLYKWCNKFKIKLGKSDFSLRRKILKKFNFEIENEKLLVKDLFSNEGYSKGYTLSTIHGIKGETFEAILLILKRRTDKSNYKKSIKNFKKNGKMNEDLRNVYVGVTRPRKILVIDVPKKDQEMWHKLLLDEPYRIKIQPLLSDFGK